MGARYFINCMNDECGFRTFFSLGGGERFFEISGFCVECDDFVYLIWDHDEPQPEPSSEIWDPKSGKRFVFNCPHCDKIFLPIYNQLDLKLCPKCDQISLDVDLESEYD